MSTVPSSIHNTTPPRKTTGQKIAIGATVVVATFMAFGVGVSSGHTTAYNDAATAAAKAIPAKVNAATKVRQDALDKTAADLSKREADDATHEADVSRRETAVGQAEAGLATHKADADRRDADLAAREDALKPREANAAKSTFGDGIRVVGRDINPGTYTAPGGSRCYWERMGDLTGGNILANDYATQGQVVVTILSSDAGFTSRDCGTWTKAN